MRRAISAIAVTAAGITWLLRSQGVIDRRAQTVPVAAGPTSGAVSTPHPDVSTSTTPRVSGPSTTAGRRQVVDGDTIDTRWGPVQVAAVIDGRHLVDVQVLQYPNERNRSVDINSQALPILHDEAIQAQSAHLDGVSGATYTWDGYSSSLQSALDKAGIGS